MLRIAAVFRLFIVTNGILWNGQCVRNWNPRYLNCDLFGQDEYDDDEEFFATLTPSSCIKECSNKGFGYAGVQFSWVCCCGGAPPPEEAVLNPSECSHKCPGGIEQCGGDHKANVYDTEGGENCCL